MNVYSNQSSHSLKAKRTFHELNKQQRSNIFQGNLEIYKSLRCLNQFCLLSWLVYVVVVNCKFNFFAAVTEFNLRGK